MSSAAPHSPGALEQLLRRDKLALLSGLAALSTLAVIYLARDFTAMRAMSAEAAMHAQMGMVMPQAWGPAEWLGLFFMWTVMMVAMMLPSAVPVMLLVLPMLRRRGDRRALLSGYVFTGGYLLVWTAFSAIAASIQWQLHRTAALSMDMRLTSGAVGAAALILAGVYQWSPLKDACLRHCRSPIDALSRYWREGMRGALLAGVRHGSYCVGCCWPLMLVLFAVGIMNLVWVLALAVLVLLEKAAPAGRLMGRAAGLAFVAWGVWLLA